VVFGLLPAIGFYVGGHILKHLLVLSSKLCDVIVARCIRCAVLLVDDLVSWVGPDLSSLLTSLRALRRNLHYSVHRCYRRLHYAIVDFLCLLIRSAARFVIRVQASRSPPNIMI
jgi:hypothetical protein